MSNIPTHASYLADVARAAHQTGKDLTLDDVAAVIEAVNSLGAPGVSTVEDTSFPAGAIVNGRTLADRLEAYPFQSEGGDLRLCADWVEFRRCFEYLAEWVGRPAPAAGDALDALRELVECDNIKKRIASMQGCIPETEDDVQELDAMMSDLARRQPAAWDAALAALAAQRKGDA